MNTAELVEWQKVAPNGLVYPWWTHPFLEQLEMSDVSDLTWLEFGAGRGTAWLRSKCKYVVSVETDPIWATQATMDCLKSDRLNGHIATNYVDHLRDGIAEDMPKYFSLIPTYEKFDAISVDGIFRTECMQWAIDHFKGRAGLLMADNWQQDYVWISPEAERIMAPYEAHRYVQPDHTNHEGKPWNTTMWIIPA